MPSCKCGIRWASLNYAHCAGCHMTFSGPSIFDMHRRDISGTGTCLDPIVIKPILILKEGVWRKAEGMPAGVVRHWQDGPQMPADLDGKATEGPATPEAPASG